MFKALKLVVQDVYLCTYFQIALVWIQIPPWILKTFVSNRVAKIQSCTQNITWKHIPSSYNISDFISRGLDATYLVDNQFWWHGPDFRTNKTNIAQPENLHLSLDDQEVILKEIKDISYDILYQILKTCEHTKLTVSQSLNYFKLIIIFL